MNNNRKYIILISLIVFSSILATIILLIDNRSNSKKTISTPQNAATVGEKKYEVGYVNVLADNNNAILVGKVIDVTSKSNNTLVDISFGKKLQSHTFVALEKDYPLTIISRSTSNIFPNSKEIKKTLESADAVPITKNLNLLKGKNISIVVSLDRDIAKETVDKNVSEYVDCNIKLVEKLSNPNMTLSNCLSYTQQISAYDP